LKLNKICGVRPVVLNKAVGEPEAEKRCHKVYFGTGWHDTLVYMLEKLGYGHVISGPAVIMNGNSTASLLTFIRNKGLISISLYSLFFFGGFW
jgi:N-methylhydantoinase A/oxoprolinase/acetone carboxylase beta subunit